MHSLFRNVEPFARRPVHSKNIQGSESLIEVMLHNVSVRNCAFVVLSPSIRSCDKPEDSLF